MACVRGDDLLSKWKTTGKTPGAHIRIFKHLRSPSIIPPRNFICRYSSTLDEAREYTNYEVSHQQKKAHCQINIACVRPVSPRCRVNCKCVNRAPGQFTKRQATYPLCRLWPCLTQYLFQGYGILLQYRPRNEIVQFTHDEVKIKVFI